MNAEAQRQLDTRAIEIASEARAHAKSAKSYADERVRAHESLCAERHATLNRNITAVGTAIETHAAATDNHFKTLYGRWYSMIAGVLLIMTGIIGYLFVKAYG